VTDEAVATYLRRVEQLRQQSESTPELSLREPLLHEAHARGVCCIERSEAILTGNLPGGTPPVCLPAVPIRARRAGQGVLSRVLTANLPAKITCDRSMQQTRSTCLWGPITLSRSLTCTVLDQPMIVMLPGRTRGLARREPSAVVFSPSSGR
jgi:hypothetical protein